MSLDYNWLESKLTFCEFHGLVSGIKVYDMLLKLQDGSFRLHQTAYISLSQIAALVLCFKAREVLVAPLPC
jgi:hypothetical protein